MGVSRSGYYDYEKRVALDPDPDHQDLVEMVRKISESSDHTYGARRMSRALKALGYEVGRRRARTLMCGAGMYLFTRFDQAAFFSI
jgi:transposase InsO family protein